MGIEYEVLGPLRVRVDAADVAVPRPAQRRLLSILLLRSEDAIRADQLTELMWGEAAPTTAANTLQAHIAGLRRILGSRSITTTDRGYGLTDVVEASDAARFDRLCDEANHELREGRAQEALRTANTAFALWRGNPYPDINDDGFARAEIRRLEERHAALHETRFAAFRDLDQLHDCIPDLEAAIHTWPLRERFREYQMLALYQAGRQADALRAFQDTRRTLGEELGIEPGPDITELENRILLQDPSLRIWNGSTPRHNLPLSGTSFVGRLADVEAVIALVADHQHVTIVGPPGIGKTRMATEVGVEVLNRFRDGVRFVSLAGVRSSSDLLSTVTQALELDHAIDTPEELARHIAGQRLLLILDNCEHLVPECQQLLKVAIPASRSLHVLATSRQPLGIPGENLWRLQPLGAPGAGESGATPQSLLGSPTIQLFLDRSRALGSGFTVNESNAAAVAELCSRTAGIPLAVELVATWVPLLGIDAILEIAGPTLPHRQHAREGSSRHSSLARALDWSTDLLASEDVAALRTAAMFEAPFTIERLIDLRGDGKDRQSRLLSVGRLVDASLLVVDRSLDDTVRYRMLVPIREYALAMAPDSVEPNDLADRYRSLYAASAEEVGRAARTAREPAAFANVDIELPDYRSALESAFRERDGRTAATIAVGLTRYWYARFIAHEGYEWLTKTLKITESPQDRLAVLLGLGFLSYIHNDYGSSDAYYSEAIEIASSLDDRHSMATAYHGLGRSYVYRDPHRATEYLTQAADLLADVPVPDADRAESLLWMGIHEARSGVETAARPALTRALAEFNAAGFEQYVSVCNRYLSLCSWHLGEEDASVELARLSLQQATDSGHKPIICGAHIQNAIVDATWGDVSTAANHVVDAFQVIPIEGPHVDTCQVLIASVPVLLRLGHPDLALSVLGCIDGRYREAGWIPLRQDMPVSEKWHDDAAADLSGAEVAEYLARGDRLPITDMVDEIHAALEPHLTGVQHSGIGLAP